MTLTFSRAKELLSYCPETGHLTWKVSRRGRLGGKRAGDRAGNAHSTGYRCITIDGREYKEHRVAWLLVHGEWPATEIDHVNCDKSDNRLENIRLASGSLNQANKRKSRNNTSGYKGVVATKDGYFKAFIGHEGRKLFLGKFGSASAAHQRYAQKAEELYGPFARPA